MLLLDTDVVKLGGHLAIIRNRRQIKIASSTAGGNYYYFFLTMIPLIYISSISYTCYLSEA